MSSSTASPSHAAQRRVLLALVVADISFAYQQTAVIPVIPVIERAVHVPQAWGAWLLSGYLLVATVATPLLGRLADRYGRRAMLLLGLCIFLLGSLGATFAPNAAVLIGCRALQGIGGAVFPLSLSILRQELPASRVTAAVGLLTGAFGTGTALGFATSGALTAAVSWRLVFAVGAGAIAVALPLVLRWVPSRPGPSTGAVNLPGAALLGGALALLLVALTVAPQEHGIGWTTPGALLCAAAVTAALWVRHENRAVSPLVDLHTLRSPTALWTNAATLAIGYVLFGTYYLVPQFVQNPQHGFAAASATVGLFLLPSALGQLLAGPATGLVQGRGTPRRPFTIGMLALAVGAAGFATLGRDSVPVFLVCAFVLGCGAGLTMSASSTLAALGADDAHVSVATSVNSTVRRVGGGIGSQVSAAVLVIARSNGSTWTLAFGLAAAVALLGTPIALRVPLRKSPTRSETRSPSGGSAPGDSSW